MILALLAACHAPPRTSWNTGEHCQQISSRFSTGGSSPAASIARRLGRTEQLLVGLGNDLEGGAPEQAGVHGLPAALDIHYAYLTGLPGPTSWTHYNPDATFVDRFIDSATDSCLVPMFTLYAMADKGEGNMLVLTDADYMGRWWSGLSLLLTRLAIADTPVLLHIEPDFWGFAQQRTNGNPASLAVHMPEDCADLSSDLIGMSACIRQRVQETAPKVVYGLHASPWAGSAEETGDFLNAIDPGDLVFTETLDRDAGCFEAGRSPHCKRDGKGWYWSDADYIDHLGWASHLSTHTGKALMWWQMPLGRPRSFSGFKNTYRDNRVKYVFDHPEQFVSAGGVGVVFGKGAPHQTSILTDKGQFEAATSHYYADPAPLR